MSQSVGISSLASKLLPAHISGQYLMCDPGVVDVGSGHVGEWLKLQVSIHNRSSEQVTLIGAESGCKCRADRNLPLTIPPHGTVNVHIEIRLGRTVGIQQDRFWLRTSHRKQPLVLCRWQGRVVDDVKKPRDANERADHRDHNHAQQTKGKLLRWFAFLENPSIQRFLGFVKSSDCASDFVRSIVRARGVLA